MAGNDFDVRDFFAEQLIDVALSDQFAFVKNTYSVANLFDIAENVGTEENRLATVPHQSDEVANQAPSQGIEAGHGLIE